MRHTLPRERDSFVGRRSDLQLLAGLLDDGAPLVSVLGIGGTGKTRLVTHYGWRWLGDWPGGVWFCDLSEARSVEGIVHAVARALEVALEGHDPVGQLGHALAGRGHCLVLLDNFEQVARHADETLGRWLDRAREAQFVVTTREVLGLPGEQVVALTPLSRTDAVELFVRRAEAAKRDFRPSGDERAAIQALVDLLDGLPLAIELAAPRVRMMSVSTLLQRMSDRFRLLTGTAGRRDRQATLRAALDWSWDLLTLPEREALAQLSVFEGGFDLEAVEAVVAVADPDAPWPLDLVQSLVDKSLVRPAGEDRFDLLVTVQEYASEHLRTPDRFPGSGPPGARDAEVRHAAWCLGLPRDRFQQELDNLVIAVRRAVARRDARAAPTLLEKAWLVLERTGPFTLGAELASAVAALEDLGRAERATVDGVHGSVHERLSRLDEAQVYYDRAFEAFREVGEPRDVAGALARLGGLQIQRGRAREAAPLLEQALAIFREHGLRRGELRVWATLGFAYQTTGRIEEAQEAYARALELAEELGDLDKIVHARAGLALLLLDRWRLDEATVILESVRDAFRQLGDRRSEGIALGNLGLAYRRQERWADAQRVLERALALHRELGTRRSEAVVCGTLASVLRDQGRHEAALPLYEQALAVHREIGNARGEGVILYNLGLLLQQLGRIDEARARCEAAIAIFRAIGGRTLEAMTLVGLGQLEHDEGRLDDAGRCFEEALAIRRATGDATGRATLGAELAMVRADQERVDEALALAQEAVDAAADDPERQRLLVVLAYVRLARGEAREAWTTLERARALAVPRPTALIPAVEALVAIALGEREAAEAAWTEAEASPAARVRGLLLTRLVQRGRALLARP